MAYDEVLAKRIRMILRGKRNITEKEQFGGVGFLVRGNMACGVLKGSLLVRVGPDRHDEAMRRKGARPFVLTGRPSRGWVLVGPSGLKTESSLEKWVDMGLEFAKGLPPK
jgi:TfoX/Sxy family transcriptional regulator of competence genes